MSKVIVYIAATLDGYIARKNDDVSWLDAFQSPTEDYGYADFIQGIGTAIMGARTYRQSLLFPERMLKGLKNYVLSKKVLPTMPDTEVVFYDGSLKALVARIHRESSRDIWIVGGGQAVSSFLSEGLVDEIRHFVVPILLKEGIPLYPALGKEIMLNLVETRAYPSGIVQLRYVPKTGLGGRIRKGGAGQ